ncbi:hypothetical protein ScPMuIL_002318 [Solemya velum]
MAAYSGRENMASMPSESICGGTSTPNMKRWSRDEMAYLEQLAGTPEVHSRRFWSECANNLNAKFATSRTGESCRVRYTKKIKPAETVEASPGILPISLEADLTRHVACQTEPAIPVHMNPVGETKPEENNSSMRKGKKDITVGGRLLHNVANETDKRDMQMSEETKKDLLSILLNSGSIHQLVACIYADDTVRQAIWSKFLAQMQYEAKSMCLKGSSYLYPKNYNALKSFSWSEVIQELVTHHKCIAQVLLAYSLPRRKLGNGDHTEGLVKILGLVFSCLMKARWKFLSRVQRVISMVLMSEKAHQRVDIVL